MTEACAKSNLNSYPVLLVYGICSSLVVGILMKLSSVVLLSVNLVAATQVAANASDTAAFLQEALAPAPAPASKLSGSTPEHRKSVKQAQSRKTGAGKSYVSMAPVIDGVKVRPFVPGRYLPSEAELQARQQSALLAAQQVCRPSGETAVLTGQVSAMNSPEFMPSYNQASAYPLSAPARTDYLQKAIQKVKQVSKEFSSARVASGLSPVFPARMSGLPGPSGAFPEIPEPREYAAPNVPSPPINKASSFGVVVPPPALTSYENRQLNQLLESNLPENVYAGFNGDMRAGQGNPGQAGAGPPPFPLTNSARGVRASTAAPARFGSWHGGNSNLPQGSFQSFVPIHKTGPLSVNIHHYSSSHRTGKQCLSSTVAYRCEHGSESVRKPAEQRVYVAVYPPYQRCSQLH